ncbi:hypothetical protein EDC04DRAFT_200516 [Pisolithus marmoratus]|nr:hypothetical protein EDC04DRAFT_200516 [Pisolithus marmoratus]
MKWFRRRRREEPWEVVGCETVDPVFMLDSEDDDDLIYVQEGDTCGRYIFDFTRQAPSGMHCTSALQFARQQLLQQGYRKGLQHLAGRGVVTDPLAPRKAPSYTGRLYRETRLHVREITCTPCTPFHGPFRRATYFLITYRSCAHPAITTHIRVSVPPL